MDTQKLSLFFFIYIFHETVELKFSRKIQGVGFPFYKIVISLGTCKEKMVYYEQSIWGTVQLNRIFNIYYKSSNPKHLVSKVEINVVLNNTDCFAYTKTGIGKSEFTGTLYLPTNMGVLIYSLSIYTCSRVGSEDDNVINKTTEDLNTLPFGQHLNMLPFYVVCDYHLDIGIDCKANNNLGQGSRINGTRAKTLGGIKYLEKCLRYTRLPELFCHVPFGHAIINKYSLPM